MRAQTTNTHSFYFRQCAQHDGRANLAKSGLSTLSDLQSFTFMTSFFVARNQLDNTRE